MKTELAIIKKYAQDSIDFGKSKNNLTAVKRGNAVLMSLTKIESEMNTDREFKNLYKKWYEQEVETNNMLTMQIVKMA